MFGGMGKIFGGLRVCFFMDWKVASKKCLKSGSEPSILRYSWSADISRFETILMKNLLKTCAIVWTSVIIFSETISFWPSWETTFFSMSVILEFVFILSVKNGFTVLQYILLSVMSLVLILLKKFSFSLLIKLTQRLRCLLYAFLSVSLFVFKNLFLGRNVFMISLFIFLFIKGSCSLEHTPFLWEHVFE